MAIFNSYVSLPEGKPKDFQEVASSKSQDCTKRKTKKAFFCAQRMLEIFGSRTPTATALWAFCNGLLTGSYLMTLIHDEVYVPFNYVRMQRIYARECVCVCNVMQYIYMCVRVCVCVCVCVKLVSVCVCLNLGARTYAYENGITVCVL